MAVVDVATRAIAGNQIWFGLETYEGKRVIVSLVDRSGGETAQVKFIHDSLDEDILFTAVASRVTNPSVSTQRRSVFLFEIIVPEGLPSNVILTSEVLDSGSIAVEHSRVAILVDEGESYTLSEIAGNDSGAGTTAVQTTGDTATVSAGDVLVIAAETTRGDTTFSWANTTHTPDMPDMMGQWDLSITSNSGASQRRGSIGYATFAEASEQVWNDTVTYNTGRHSSALIAVWRVSSQSRWVREDGVQLTPYLKTEGGLVELE